MAGEPDIPHAPSTVIKPLQIIFDTSILRGVSVRKPSPEFRLLQRLAKAGKLKLVMPEIVAREWLSQLSESVTGALDTLSKAINDVLREPSLSKVHNLGQLAETQLNIPDVVRRLQSSSLEWYRNQVAELGISELPFDPGDARSVLEDYFKGRGAFSSKKSRNDFPDSFVLAVVVRESLRDHRSIFACGDKRLRVAAQAHNVTTAKSILELLQMDAIASLHGNAALALWWEQHFSNVIAMVRDRKATLMECVTSLLYGQIVSREIEDPEIPEDNHRAYVESASIYEDEVTIGWDEAQSIGEGLLTVPIRFIADVDIRFSVYRGDFFALPDWAHGTMGDWEDDHYFDASGSRIAIYKGRLVLGFGDSVMKGEFELPGADIAVEEVEFEEFVQDN